jgi:hypothetical protein
LPLPDIQDRIVDQLAGPFISDCAIDPAEVASRIRVRSPEFSAEDLALMVARLAKGLGLRIKQDISRAAAP